MRHLFYVIIWLTGFLSLASCRPQHISDAKLIQADSLMKEFPDSALRILENIEPQLLKSQADHAYYALLLTQARDKNYIVQTDDSLIKSAVSYYDVIQDRYMQAKAYYYWGSVYRDMNQCGEAIKKYLTAIAYAKENDDKRLLGVLYINTGYLYYTQNIDEKADSLYQLTEQYAIQIKDSILLAETLYRQGKLYMQNGPTYHEKAEKYMVRAFNISNNLGCKNIKIGIISSLSSLYSRMNQSKKAIHCAKKYISLLEDTINCYRAFLLLGDAYFKAEQYDSAAFYFHKSSPSKSYNTKASAYMRLADIAQIQGNLNLSLEMERIYSAYKDSINMSQQSIEILNAEKEIQLIEQQVYYQSYLSKYTYYFISTFIAIILIVICLLHKRYKRKAFQINQERLLLEEKQQALNELYLQLKEELEIKDEEIKKLKNEIASQQTSNREKQILQIELNKLSQKREALAKEALEHSKIYAKMERIISDFKMKDESEEKMSNEDWQQLLIETDMRWNGGLSALSAQYKFSSKEMHLICLFLTDFPFSNLEYITGTTRRTLYRNKDKILSQMGTIPNSDFECIIKKLRK